MNLQTSGGSTTTGSGLKQFPKFGPGELPVEYTPLNEQTLKARDRFGPVSFLVSASSHEHHAEFINRSSDAKSPVDFCQLYPFEFWPLPRVMSQWRFGRLNEVISIRARRTVGFRPKVNHTLIGETVVRSIAKQSGLCFGFFESTTKTINGETCMTAEDVLLLANGCDLSKLREVVSEAIANKVFVFVDSASSILASWTLQMRYVWPEHKWRNNIHTDIYARQLGYERGLVEGPGVADVVYALYLGTGSTLEKLRVSWEYLAPLYESTRVVLVSHNRSESRGGRFSVCELPPEIPGQCRVLLTVEFETL